MDEENYRVVDIVNKKVLSEIVYDHPYGNIFQTPEMAEVYKRTKNYESITLVVVEDALDEILALLHAGIIKETSGLLGQFSTRSIITGGPLFVEKEAGLKATSLLMHRYEEIAREKKVIYSEIRMLNEIPALNAVLLQQDYFFEEHFNAVIDLRKSKEALWQQLKRDKKRGIKKAKELKITIEKCTQKKDISLCYDLLQETYKNAKIPLADISLFESVFDILVPMHEAVFLLAKYKNKSIATQVALMYRDIIYAWFTGADREYLSYHPGDLLIWRLLEFGAENGYKTFDFGGGGTPTKNVNIREYKARFGSAFFSFGRYKKVHSPIKMKIAEKGFEVYRRITL